ncbi:MAG TPA: hypothetical protein VNF05_02785 [Acidimicrobiales bacterium]|nr:hypothetical protein [Acidimicrobiales bacterium]
MTAGIGEHLEDRCSRRGNYSLDGENVASIGHIAKVLQIQWENATLEGRLKASELDTLDPTRNPNADAHYVNHPRSAMTVVLQRLGESQVERRSTGALTTNGVVAID